MKTTTKPRKAGLLVHPDDLQVGHHYAVYSIRSDPKEAHPILGQSFTLKAMNLPFIIGQLVSDPTHPPVTLDVRFLDFMRVTLEYVEAQKPHVSASNQRPCDSGFRPARRLRPAS